MQAGAKALVLRSCRARAHTRIFLKRILVVLVVKSIPLSQFTVLGRKLVSRSKVANKTTLGVQHLLGMSHWVLVVEIPVSASCSWVLRRPITLRSDQLIRRFT